MQLAVLVLFRLQAARGGARSQAARPGLRALAARLHAQLQATAVVHATRVPGLRPGATRDGAVAPARPLHLCNATQCNSALAATELRRLCVWYRRVMTKEAS
jgi:hypothetical protein